MALQASAQPRPHEGWEHGLTDCCGPGFFSCCAVAPPRGQDHREGAEVDPRWRTTRCAHAVLANQTFSCCTGTMGKCCVGMAALISLIALAKGAAVTTAAGIGAAMLCASSCGETGRSMADAYLIDQMRQHDQRIQAQIKDLEGKLKSLQDTAKRTAQTVEQLDKLAQELRKATATIVKHTKETQEATKEVHRRLLSGDSSPSTDANAAETSPSSEEVVAASPNTGALATASSTPVSQAPSGPLRTIPLVARLPRRETPQEHTSVVQDYPEE